jgi:hypothetical protein
LTYSGKEAIDSLTDGAVDRIIAAVGEKFIPAQFDKAALLRGLELCRRSYRVALYLASNKPERMHVRRLAMTRKTARRLGQLLASDDIQMLFFPPPPPEESLDAEISRLVNMLDAELARPGWKRGPHQAYYASFKALSAFDWLAGYYLPDVFELAFDRRPSSSESDPTIRFIEAVLAELKIGTRGKPYSRASIARALRHRGASRIRRKSATTVEEHYRWWRPIILEAFRTVVASRGRPTPALRAN